MNIPTYIRNHESVVSFFGLWPSFHDANVVAYELRDGKITLTLHTWLMTREVDPKGFFVLKNHALVNFRFGDLYNVKMEAFKSENILFTLEISPSLEPSSFNVELDSVMDMSGSFSARSGEIVSIIPCTADGKPVS
jgi:hypothetical protein